MTLLGTALRPAATRVMLLGSGELGKEVAIECQRLGVEVIAVDRYADAPAMHVAHRSHVINMLDGDALRRVVELEKPHYIVPEIEAIATDMLIQLEEEGLNVVPCARATKLTMNREGIRRLAAEELSRRPSGLRKTIDRFNSLAHRTTWLRSDFAVRARGKTVRALPARLPKPEAKRS